VSFFEVPPEPPTPPPMPRHEWLGPPDNVRPEPFPLAVTLARTDELFVQVYQGLAFPAGFEFTFQLLRRERHHARFDNPIHAWHELRRGADLPSGSLRFGIQDADGGKATVLGHLGEPGEPPSGPILRPYGSSSSPTRADARFWVWPIPPAGPFAFVVEWPSEGIALTRAEIDTAPIRDAAARADELWPSL
jgi:hypothetical protein